MNFIKFLFKNMFFFVSIVAMAGYELRPYSNASHEKLTNPLKMDRTFL